MNGGRKPMTPSDPIPPLRLDPRHRLDYLTAEGLLRELETARNGGPS